MKRVAPPALPQGPQHYWSQMLAMSKTGGFTVTGVAKASSCRSRSTIKEYVRFCLAQGYLEHIGDQPTIKSRVAHIYRVVDPRLAAPVMRRTDFANDRGRRAQQMWTAMRAMRTFTVQELGIAASTDTVVVPEPTARGFVRALAKAGYVVEISRRSALGQRARWKLLPACNTGPAAPAFVDRGRVLVDRNTGRSVNLNVPETARRAA